MSATPVYLVAGSPPWSRKVFDQSISKYPGSWHFVSRPEELTVDLVVRLVPRYVFFLHWSWRVPAEIVGDYECVCFHMTDVPFGRGGSPLQNLIVRGYRRTKLTALRMVEAFDAGPVYLKADLSLAGSAEEIYLRASHLSARMIGQLIERQPTPTPQQGEPIVFKRRRPDESRIGARLSPTKLYDFIRMLDAEGYPRAYVEHAGYRWELSSATLEQGEVRAAVTIRPLDEQ